MTAAPQRTCIGCRKVRPKAALLRLVRYADGRVDVDDGGGVEGRGAYVCTAVECMEKTGHSSFTVNTLPQDWTFVSEEQVNQSYRILIDLACKAQDAGLKGKFALEKEQMLTELRKCRSSHHALVVEATAKVRVGDPSDSRTRSRSSRMSRARSGITRPSVILSPGP